MTYKTIAKNNWTDSDCVLCCQKINVYLNYLYYILKLLIVTLVDVLRHGVISVGVIYNEGIATSIL